MAIPPALVVPAFAGKAARHSEARLHPSPARSNTGERHAAMPHVLADDVPPLGPHTAAADASLYGV